MPHRTLSALLCLALVAACGRSPKRSPQEAVHPVMGAVFAGPRAAAGARVVFHPTDSARAERPTAEAGEDGTFRVTTYVRGDGAPEGEYAVTIVWPTPPNGPQSDEEGPDRFGGRYATLDRPAAKVTIRAGANELEPFRLAPVR